MEAVTKLQHVVGHGKFHSGKRVHLSSEILTEGFPPHNICERWNLAHYGSKTFGEEAFPVEIKTFLGFATHFIIQACFFLSLEFGI
jgi:hypothetical protein